jgi:methionine biosynthesis protein MetW
MGLIQAIYNCALRLKGGTEFLAYGRPIIKRWVVQYASEKNRPGLKILDIGCGSGADLENLRAVLNDRAEIYGVENYEPDRATCREKGIDVIGLDIERERLPYSDQFFDVILINQVLEHTKEIFFILSEISRALKKEGLLIVGLPNLATWHDRLLLLLGQQPSGTKVLGPHIRGITLPGFRAFVECEGYFRLLECRGSGFYPFPVWFGKLLAKLFPTLATSLFYKIVRCEKPGSFIEVLEKRRFQTNYFTG